MRQQGKRGQRIAVVPTILVVAARFSHTPTTEVMPALMRAWASQSKSDAATPGVSSATVQASGKGHVHNAGIRGIGPLAGRLGADLLARVWPAWRDQGAAEPCEAGP